jgi:hypothetical protein
MVSLGYVEVRTSKPELGWPLWNICVTNDHGYDPLCVSTSQSVNHSWLITGCVTILTRRVSLVEQELFTPFGGVSVTRSLVLCVCFVDHCLSFDTLSFGLCVVCSSLIYGFWLHLWYLLTIVLSVPLWYREFDYTFGILWPLCGLFFFDIRLLITPLVYCGHCVVCSSLIYGFLFHLWYLVAIVLSVLLWYTDSDYTFGILWPLCCMFFFDIRILMTHLVYCGHCVVCSSLIYGFWSHLWYLVVIVLSVLLWYTDYDYTFGILWPLCCLFFFDMRIVIPPLLSCGHCVVCSSLICGLWFHL